MAWLLDLYPWSNYNIRAILNKLLAILPGGNWNVSYRLLKSNQNRIKSLAGHSTDPDSIPMRKYPALMVVTGFLFNLPASKIKHNELGISFFYSILKGRAWCFQGRKDREPFILAISALRRQEIHKLSFEEWIVR